jgi:hypothetical protein
VVQSHPGQTGLIKTLHKKGLSGVAQGVGPEFKPQYHKKTKQQENPPFLSSTKIILEEVFFHSTMRKD